MNERIRELLNEATVGLEPDLSPQRTVTLNELEKFAELIVAECIGCCEQVISDPVPESVDTWLNGGEQCIQEIKSKLGYSRIGLGNI